MVDGFTRWASTPQHPRQPDARQWVRPDDEVVSLSFSAQLADVLLSGHGSPHATCNISKCEDEINTPGYPTCCWPQIAKSPDLLTLSKQLRETVGDTSESWNNADCSDKLDFESWSKFGYARFLNGIFPAFAEAVSEHDTSCISGCPNRFKSVCDNGTCTLPSCEHAAKFCQQESKAGNRACMFCGVTCGCDIHNVQPADIHWIRLWLCATMPCQSQAAACPGSLHR